MCEARDESISCASPSVAFCVRSVGVGLAPSFGFDWGTPERNLSGGMRATLAAPFHESSSHEERKFSELQIERMRRNRSLAIERLRARGIRPSLSTAAQGVEPTGEGIFRCRKREGPARVQANTERNSSDSLSSCTVDESGNVLDGQEYDYFVVLDIESTCDKRRKLHPQEIIEFSAVLLNLKTMEIDSRFQEYVRPTVNPTLTAFCRELTGIRQECVDSGMPLQEMLVQHDRWLRGHKVMDKRFIYMTWTAWDLMIMLEQERKWRKLAIEPYLRRWIDLKVMYTKHYGKKNLKGAVKELGLNWYGRAHSGIDDAINTANIACELMRQGVVMHQTGAFSEEKKKLGSIRNYFRASPRSGSTSGNYCYCGIPRAEKMKRQSGANQDRRFSTHRRNSALCGSSCHSLKWTTPVK